MPFPWTRYWRRVGVAFAVALVVSLAVMLIANDGRLAWQTALIAVVDSAVLAIVVGLPLAHPIGRRPPR